MQHNFVHTYGHPSICLWCKSPDVAMSQKCSCGSKSVFLNDFTRWSQWCVLIAKALQKHWPSPKGYIKGHISLLAGMYLINTRLRLFWPEAFRFSSLSISVRSGARTINSLYCLTSICGLRNVLGNTPVDNWMNQFDPIKRAQWRRDLWPHCVT